MSAIKVTLTIDEENLPSLYKSVSTISPRRRAKYLSNRLFLLFEGTSGKHGLVNNTDTSATNDIGARLESKAGADESAGGAGLKNNQGGMGFAEKLVSGAGGFPSGN